MNYRHAFHAGNHADVLKHWLLCLCLARLAAKPTPFAVLDTHAGIGVYDLAGPEAARSPEWRRGVALLEDWARAPDELAPYRDTVRWLNDGAPGLARYPGSPALALAFLRPQDRYVGCELHPEDFARLRQALGADPRAQLHHRDGFAAIPALLPFPERRGLVLIDPPYEDRARDLARAIAAIKAGVARFRQGVWLWWRPMIAPGEIDAADRALAGVGVEALRADLAVDAPQGLAASSMLVLNPPFGLAEALRAAGPALAARLAQGSGAGFHLAVLERM